MNLENNLLDTANQSSVKVTHSDTAVTLQQQLRLDDKSTLGVVLFLMLGILLIVLTTIKKMELTSAFALIVAGIFIILLSVVTLIRQSMDFVRISEGRIDLRHNLRYTSLPIKSTSRIEMRTEIMEVRRSAFYHVSFYVHHDDKERRIFTFHMDNSEAEKTAQLGRALKNILNEKIRYYQK